MEQVSRELCLVHLLGVLEPPVCRAGPFRTERTLQPPALANKALVHNNDG